MAIMKKGSIQTPSTSDVLKRMSDIHADSFSTATPLKDTILSPQRPRARRWVRNGLMGFIGLIFACEIPAMVHMNHVAEISYESSHSPGLTFSKAASKLSELDDFILRGTQDKNADVASLAQDAYSRVEAISVGEGELHELSTDDRLKYKKNVFDNIVKMSEAFGEASALAKSDPAGATGKLVQAAWLGQEKAFPFLTKTSASLQAQRTKHHMAGADGAEIIHLEMLAGLLVAMFLMATQISEASKTRRLINPGLLMAATFVLTSQLAFELDIHKVNTTLKGEGGAAENQITRLDNVKASLFDLDYTEMKILTPGSGDNATAKKVFAGKRESLLADSGSDKSRDLFTSNLRNALIVAEQNDPQDAQILTPKNDGLLMEALKHSSSNIDERRDLSEAAEEYLRYLHNVDMMELLAKKGLADQAIAFNHSVSKPQLPYPPSSQLPDFGNPEKGMAQLQQFGGTQYFLNAMSNELDGATAVSAVTELGHPAQKPVESSTLLELEMFNLLVIALSLFLGFQPRKEFS